MNFDVEIEIGVIKDAKSGNKEAVDEIFTKYQQFIYLNAKNYFLVGADKDDLIQEGMIGLLKAIRAYDETKMASFKTFAAICIKRQIITAIKAASSQKNMALNSAVSIQNQLIQDREVNYFKGLSSYVIYSPEDLMLSKEQVMELKKFLEENLSSFEVKVFKEMVLGHNYREIAVKLEKNAKAIDNAMQRIKRKSEVWLEGYTKTRVG